MANCCSSSSEQPSASRRRVLSLAAIRDSLFCTTSRAMLRPGVSRSIASSCSARHSPRSARRDAARLERLDDAQRRLDLSRRRARRQRRDVLERQAQEAVVVQGVDDEVREHVIALRQAQKQQLLTQRVMQGRGRGGPFRPVGRLLAAAATTAAGRKIEVGPGAVLGRLLALRARIGRFRRLRALLEEGILRDRLVQFLHAFQCGKLQQLYRLLQPRCQRELLLQAQSQYGIGHSRNPLSQVSTAPASAAQHAAGENLQGRVRTPVRPALAQTPVRAT